MTLYPVAADFHVGICVIRMMAIRWPALAAAGIGSRKGKGPTEWEGPAECQGRPPDPLYLRFSRHLLIPADILSRISSSAALSSAGWNFSPVIFS